MASNRDVLVRVDPDQLDRALRRFDAARGSADDAIAIDGKAMRNAIYADTRAPQARGPRANGDANARRRPRSAEPVPRSTSSASVGQPRRHPHPKKVDCRPKSAPTTSQAHQRDAEPSSPCSNAWSSTSRQDSPPTPCSPSASSPTSSAPAAPTSCSPPRATSRHLDDLRPVFGPREPDIPRALVASNTVVSKAAFHLDARPTQRPPDLPPRRPGLPRRATATRRSPARPPSNTPSACTSHDARYRRRPARSNSPRPRKVESVHNIRDNAFDVQDRLRIGTGDGTENPPAAHAKRHRCPTPTVQSPPPTRKLRNRRRVFGSPVHDSTPCEGIVPRRTN